MYGSPMQSTIFDQVDNYLHMVGDEDEKKSGTDMDFDIHKETIPFDMEDLQLESLAHDDFAGMNHHGLHLDIQADESVSTEPKDTPSLMARNSIQLTNEGTTSALTTPFLSGKMDDNGVEPPHYNRTQSLGKSGSVFSPLSSPALMSNQQAQQSWKPSSRRASNSSSRSKRIMVNGSSSVSSSSNKVVKSSPYMNASSRRLQKTMSNGNSVKRDDWDEFMFSLPESSLGNDKDADNDTEKKHSEDSYKLLDVTQNNVFPQVILPSNSLDTKGDGFVNQFEKQFADHSIPQQDSKHPSSRSGTSTENTSVSPSYRSDNILMATESPVIRPSGSSTTLKHSRHSSSTKLFKSPIELNSTENDKSPVLPPPSVEQQPKSSNKTKRSGSMTKARSNSLSQEESIQRKKEVHKNAEQERRNRLNNALSELNSLLPKEWKDAVAIPSKAITAQLACKYIRKLEAELEQYRK